MCTSKFTAWQAGRERGSMNIAALLLYAVAGWCAIGLLGTLLSLAQGRRAEGLKHAAWLAVVGGIYLTVLLATSIMQKQRVVAIGQNQCFGTMCYRVTAVDEVPGLVAGSTDRVVRVRIAITNRGTSTDEEPALRAYVLDSQGRPWDALPGLSGNPLSSRVAPDSEVVSQPMFRIAANSTGLGLVLTHGTWQRRQFLLGDSDSLAHKATIVALGR